MEIKNVKMGKNYYPQKQDITEKTLNKFFLDKWKTLGIASIISNGLLAVMTRNCEVKAMQLSGDVAVVDENVVETTNTIEQNGNTTNHSGSSAARTNQPQTNEFDMYSMVVVGVMLVIILTGLVMLFKTKDKGNKGEG